MSDIGRGLDFAIKAIGCGVFLLGAAGAGLIGALIYLLFVR